MDETQKENQGASVPISDPGSVITPASAPINANPTPTPPQPPQPENVAPEPSPNLSDSTPPPPPASLKTEEPSTSEESESTEPAQTEDQDSQSISWKASEFHEHQKSAGWYLALILITVAAAAILYVWTRSIITTVVVAVCGLILGIYGARKPDELEYSMDSQGIQIGSKQYHYDEFRLFIITPELTLPEVTLVPVKRFMPSLSIRYAPEVKANVLDILGDHLPFEERRPDFIDSLMHKIHF